MYLTCQKNNFRSRISTNISQNFKNEFLIKKWIINKKHTNCKFTEMKINFAWINRLMRIATVMVLLPQSFELRHWKIIYSKSPSEFFKKIFTLAEVVDNIIFQQGLLASETKSFSAFQIPIFASFFGLRIFA